ncbi:MAG: transposase, partial [Chitinophagales bacterium]|nr:transposase [Chitinophagales bacterium]
MKYKYIMGVDMSKSWFHYCLKNKDHEIIQEGEIPNTIGDIYTFISHLEELLGKQELTDIVLCMEYTGIYVKHLVRCWLSRGGQLSMVHASKLSEQLSGKQGWLEKSDALDARRLAEYGIRFQDQLKPAGLKDETLDKLQAMQRQRERILKAINLLEVPVKESKGFDNTSIYTALENNQANSILALRQDLKKIEKALEQVINEDPLLKHLFKLIKSVEGVGAVTAREIIISTQAFTKFNPGQAKKYARYVGVVPRQWSSGSSIRKKNKTSKRRHKKLNSLLTNGVISLIGTKNELAIFYQRKRQEGKEHMSVVNAIRNK